MLIKFAGYTLADPAARYPATALRVNGEALWEAVQLVRAARQRLYARGNELVTLSFGTSREFASRRLAERYLLGWWSQIPKTGTCEIVIGDAGDTEVITMPGAILTAIPEMSQLGWRITTQYSIAAPGVDLDTPIETPTGAIPMLQAERQSITSGATSVEVVFPSPFAAAPVVTANVAAPGSGGDVIWATVRHDLTTTHGTTIELSGPTPAAGYLLYWQAIDKTPSIST